MRRFRAAQATSGRRGPGGPSPPGGADHGIPHPGRLGGYHGRPRRESLVHRVRRSDRPDHSGRSDHRVPHPSELLRTESHHGRPDGNLWFTYEFGITGLAGSLRPARSPCFPPFRQSSAVCRSRSRLDRMATSGSRRSSATRSVGSLRPARSPSSPFPDPGDIKAGPDGNLWFTESEPIPPQLGQRNMIGRVTPSGQVTEFPLNGFLMSGETFGPDGNLWFTKGVYEPLAGGPPGAAKRVEYLSRITPAAQRNRRYNLGNLASGESQRRGDNIKLNLDLDLDLDVGPVAANCCLPGGGLGPTSCPGRVAPGQGPFNQGLPVLGASPVAHELVMSLLLSRPKRQKLRLRRRVTNVLPRELPAPARPGLGDFRGD